ncbi:MAG: carbamoyl-phosphate synthase large subunit, partial [Gammaproteobacteria bacterium]
LAVGYTLDEIRNEITGGNTPASFEPTIDYVVTKVPRFDFEKFPHANDRLTTQMKSVGEVMAIGRTFQESLQKALRGLETGTDGLNPQSLGLADAEARQVLQRELSMAGPQRLWHVADAFRLEFEISEVARLSGIDPWFLGQLRDLVKEEQEIGAVDFNVLSPDHLLRLKRKGFSDSRIASLMGTEESVVRKLRHKHNLRPVYKRVDTCAAEFASHTAYLYSTYEEECEAEPVQGSKIIILGGGPNRIGQGIEFDYCCVHASLALKEVGFETIMVNCNPETVSTDYDTSDRLYFESLTLEDVLEIVYKEKPTGVIVQYGGQTPLKLARKLEEAGVPIIGTSPDSIDLAEDRERFQQLIKRLGLKQPPNSTARTQEEALAMGDSVGYPLVVRPSYVLGGRAMEIVHSKDDLKDYITAAVSVSNESPVLLDRFLDQAVEVDVDAICDGNEVIIGGIMEHVEQAGVHSGDSGCSLPPFTLDKETEVALSAQVVKMAKALHVVGIMNAQFAIQNGVIHVLEVNPRASRTIPFVSKAVGQPLAKIAAKAMVGISFKKQGIKLNGQRPFFAVKESVFPFIKFPDADPILGPEMKSTGEVMGIGKTFAEAYAKAQLASGVLLPNRGTAFISVRDVDKSAAVELAGTLVSRGFEVVATGGTAWALAEGGVPCRRVNKVSEGRPHIVDMIKNKEISLIVNTTEGKQAIAESHSIRVEAVCQKVTYYTTLAAARATCDALDHLGNEAVYRLQDLHKEMTV